MRLTFRQAKALGLQPNGQPVDPELERRKRRRQARANAAEKQGRERMFNNLCRVHDLPIPVHEYEFCEGRRWRFDYLFEGWLAVEKVGGVWTRGHHSRGRDQIQDMEKFNQAQLMGYTVLQFTPEQFDNGTAFAEIRRALGHAEEIG